MKSKFRKILLAFGCFFLLLLLGVVGIYLYLPTYIETTLLPQIEREAGIGNINCKVHKVGLLHADFRDLRIGEKEMPAFSIDSIKIDYSPMSLMRKHINKIVLNGVRLSLAYKDGKIIAPGLKLDKLKKGKRTKVGTKTKPGTKAKFKMPLTIGLFEIRDGLLNLDSNQKQLRIPFNVKIISLKEDLTAASSSLHLKIENSDIELGDKNISIEGLNLDLKFADLLKFKSPPRQILTFRKASFGDLTFDDGKTVFQIESPQLILVEEGDYVWSGGHIKTQTMRINPQKQEYSASLFCDHLDLTQMLNGLGVAHATGKGTISGIIKFEIKNRKIIFKDSLLYSTPGTAGVLKLTGTEILTAGIPTDSPQYLQLEFARQALNNFKYDWVKLNLTSKGNDCILKLSLQGKPAKPISYKFAKRINPSIKADIEGNAAIIQPIRLDVNFKIPLNDMMQYHKRIKGKLDSILE